MDKRVTLKIDGDIGTYDPMLQVLGYDAPVISSRYVDDFLIQNSSAEEILIEINSYGGNVDEALIIYDKLRASGKKLIVHGYKVASAATIIMLAAEKQFRLISENAVFVAHFPYISNPAGDFTAEDLRELANMMNEYENKIISIYKNRLQLNSQQVKNLRDLMAEDKDIGSKGAIEWGFASSKLNSKNIRNQKGSPFAYTNTQLQVFAKLNQKSNMKVSNQSWLTNLLMKAGLIVKAASVNLMDGVTIYFAEEFLAVGVKVYLDETLTEFAPEGEHTLEDGKIIVVDAEGTVTEIKEMVTEENGDTLNVEISNEIEDAVAVVIEASAKKIKALEVKNAKLMEEIKALKSAVAGSPIATPQNQEVEKPVASSESKFNAIKNRAKTKFN